MCSDYVWSNRTLRCHSSDAQSVNFYHTWNFRCYKWRVPVIHSGRTVRQVKMPCEVLKCVTAIQTVIIWNVIEDMQLVGHVTIWVFACSDWGRLRMSLGQRITWPKFELITSQIQDQNTVTHPAIQLVLMILPLGIWRPEPAAESYRMLVYRII